MQKMQFQIPEEKIPGPLNRQLASSVFLQRVAHEDVEASFNPFPGKTETERRGNFENL
jgi:hypothetical protein